MPDGRKLPDGFPTTIAFASAPNISLWENTVQAPGADSGGPNDTTSMRNLIWRTMAPKKLKTLTVCTGDCQFDPQVLTDIMNQLGNPQLFTVLWPNGAKWAFWGFLDKFIPQKNQEGKPPIADFTIQPTNQDTTGAEVAPVYTAPAATTTVTTTTL